MLGLNSNQIGGILRAVLPPIVAYAAAKGWVAANSVADISAAIVTIIVALWSVHTNKAP